MNRTFLFGSASEMITSTTEFGDARRIQRLSKWLASACLALIVVLPIAVVIYWAVTDPAELAARGNLTTGAIQAPLLAWQRVAGAVVTEIPLALLLIGLWQARKCFKLFAAGRVFTADAVRCLRQFAGWVMVSVAAGIVAGTVISVLLTVHNPANMRHLAVGIGSDQIFTLFFAGMVWLMAAVIAQGQTLAEENATFI
jgi:membrane protease YdiL (CAAX protease family)